MPRRTWERNAKPRNTVIDLHTGQPVQNKPIPIVCERIRYYRELLRIEQKELASRIGVTPNAVTNWEKGYTKPNVNILPDICKALHITLYQIYGMEDPTIRLTASEGSLIEDYRLLSPGHQMAIRNMTQTLLEVQDADRCPDILKLLFFEHQLAAGIGDPLEFEDTGIPIFVYANDFTRRADWVFTVNGDSMEPDYPDGCMVLVKRLGLDDTMLPGEVGAFMLDNETYIKEYQEDGLHSCNPEYPVMRFTEYESVYLIGHVVGILSRNDVAKEADVKKYSALHPEFE